MSISSLRGKALEKRLALRIRQLLGIAAFRDKRSGAGSTYKADIAAPGFFAHIEAKAQETIKLREWWAQTREGCPPYKTPVLALELGSDDLAVLRFDDLLGLVKTAQEDAEVIATLRAELAMRQTSDI